MIVAAAALVLLGLGLFVAGLNTGVTALYWACVAACAVAAVLLVAARRQMNAVPPGRGAAIRASDVVKVPDTAAKTPQTAAKAPDAAPQAPAGTPAADQPSAEAGSPAEAAAEQPVASAAPPHPSSDGQGGAAGPRAPGEPPLEEVEVTDLLLVVDLTDEVLVVDEHPRYHLAGCRHLAGRETIPLPLDEARTDGFTPCGVCSPDRNLAERVRARKAGRG